MRANRRGVGHASALASGAAAVALAFAGQSFAQTAPQNGSADDLATLRAELQALKAEEAARAHRIEELERRLDAATRQVSTAATAEPAVVDAVPPPPTITTAQMSPPSVPRRGDEALPESVQAPTQSPAEPAQGPPAERWPAYEEGKGFGLVKSRYGELGMGMYSYFRYINQNDLPPEYVDSFGRLKSIDRRQDVQIAKISMNLKGWLFDPKFRYYYFFWTNQANMGEGAQVVIGGYFQYVFNKALTVTAGVMPLPTTRSTNYTFPNWLRNDNRVMADEFFRGSYSTGIDAQGEIVPRLRYRVAVANNLAQLGVSAAELDNMLNTWSGVVWWMPTTGEFGPASGFGDFEDHQRLATLFGAHFTYSRENAQGQPSVNDFENSQIRLSDGTLVFSPDPFGTGGSVKEADYHMAAANAGFKYRGWYLEGEYYWRWVNNFDVINGVIPVTSLYDHGYTLRASAMVVPRTWQAYVTASHIYGEYGDPSEFAVGATWYPFDRKEVRLNVQGLYLDHSPIGGNTVVAQVGGSGWVLSSDIIVVF
jgi:hypothetical protein